MQCVILSSSSIKDLTPTTCNLKPVLATWGEKKREILQLMVVANWEFWIPDAAGLLQCAIVLSPETAASEGLGKMKAWVLHSKCHQPAVRESQTSSLKYHLGRKNMISSLVSYLVKLEVPGQPWDLGWCQLCCFDTCRSVAAVVIKVPVSFNFKVSFSWLANVSVQHRILWVLPDESQIYI